MPALSMILPRRAHPLVVTVTALVWLTVTVVMLASLGRYLVASQPLSAPATITSMTPWSSSDASTPTAEEKARTEALVFAAGQLDALNAELQGKIDQNFLPWYFSYPQQIRLGLIGLGYWLSDTPVVERLIGPQDDPRQRMAALIEGEFAVRVIQPQKAEQKLQAIARATQVRFLASAQGSGDLLAFDTNQRFLLDEIGFLVAITQTDPGSILKTTATSGAAGGALAATLAAKSSSAVGVKAGAAAIGPIAGLGLIAWDLWDHHQAEAVERPFLRQNFAVYLSMVKNTLLHDPEHGLLTPVTTIGQAAAPAGQPVS